MNKYTVLVAGLGVQEVQADRHFLSESGLTLLVGDAVVGRFPEYQGLLIELPPHCPAQSAPVSVSDALGVTASVALVAGESLLVSSPLCEAVESTARALSAVPYAESHDLRNHLRGLLAEQKAQLFTSRPDPVAQQIGTV